MKIYPKRIKELLRAYTSEAYERELHRELIILERSFEQWRSFELAHPDQTQPDLYLCIVQCGQWLLECPT